MSQLEYSVLKLMTIDKAGGHPVMMPFQCTDHFGAKIATHTERDQRPSGFQKKKNYVFSPARPLIGRQK